MHTFLKFFIASLIWLGATSIYAQDANSIDKTLLKAVSVTKGTRVDIPTMEKNRSTDKLSKVVKSAINSSLKAARKTNLWSVGELQPTQVDEVAASGSPFTTLFEIKGNKARSEFESMIANQLEKSGAFTLLKEQNDDFDQNEVVQAVVEGTIAELDENGSRLLDSM